MVKNIIEKLFFYKKNNHFNSETEVKNIYVFIYIYGFPQGVYKNARILSGHVR